MAEPRVAGYSIAPTEAGVTGCHVITGRFKTSLLRGAAAVPYGVSRRRHVRPGVSPRHAQGGAGGGEQGERGERGERPTGLRLGASRPRPRRETFRRHTAHCDASLTLAWAARPQILKRQRGALADVAGNTEAVPVGALKRSRQSLGRRVSFAPDKNLVELRHFEPVRGQRGRGGGSDRPLRAAPAPVCRSPTRLPRHRRSPGARRPRQTRRKSASRRQVEQPRTRVRVSGRAPRTVCAQGCP